MWCLVLGCIGMFDSLCGDPSPLSRYIADSAYWVYLIHIPILFQLELFVADSRWGFGGVPKFAFYVIGMTLLCFASYHYLVRSTFIGKALNGRVYPFVPWFGKRVHVGGNVMNQTECPSEVNVQVVAHETLPRPNARTLESDVTETTDNR